MLSLEPRLCPESLKLALAAAEQTNQQNPFVLEVLAAAYAETGDFANALETERRAMQLVDGNSPLAAQMQQRIQLYAAGKPLRLGN